MEEDNRLISFYTTARRSAIALLCFELLWIALHCIGLFCIVECFGIRRQSWDSLLHAALRSFIQRRSSWVIWAQRKLCDQSRLICFTNTTMKWLYILTFVKSSRWNEKFLSWIDQLAHFLGDVNTHLCAYHFQALILTQEGIRWQISGVRATLLLYKREMQSSNPTWSNNYNWQISWDKYHQTNMTNFRCESYMKCRNAVQSHLDSNCNEAKKAQV